MSKLSGHGKSGHKRKVHIITGLSPKIRTSSNEQLNISSLKKTEKEVQMRLKGNRMKEIIKIRTEINEI